jgi:hypothetical protein
MAGCNREESRDLVAMCFWRSGAYLRRARRIGRKEAADKSSSVPCFRPLEEQQMAWLFSPAFVGLSSSGLAP